MFPSSAESHGFFSISSCLTFCSLPVARMLTKKKINLKIKLQAFPSELQRSISPGFWRNRNSQRKKKIKLQENSWGFHLGQSTAGVGLSATRTKQQNRPRPRPWCTVTIKRWRSAGSQSQEHFSPTKPSKLGISEPKGPAEFPSQNQLHVGWSRTQTRLCLPPFSGYKEKTFLPLLHILICLQSGKLRDSPLSHPSKNNSKAGTRLKDGGTGSDFPWDQHHQDTPSCHCCRTQGQEDFTPHFSMS